jgi:hypothetical protein
LSSILSPGLKEKTPKRRLPFFQEVGERGFNAHEVHPRRQTHGNIDFLSLSQPLAHNGEEVSDLASHRCYAGLVDQGSGEAGDSGDAKDLGGLSSDRSHGFHHYPVLEIAGPAAEGKVDPQGLSGAEGREAPEGSALAHFAGQGLCAEELQAS